MKEQLPKHRRHRSITAASLSLLLLLALGETAAAAGGETAARTSRAPSGVANTTAKTKVMTCSGKAVYEPKSYVVYCADANGILLQIHWSSWRNATASATATYSANDCKPYCAAGKFIRYKAGVLLLRPKETKYGSLFSELEITYLRGHETVILRQSLPLKPL
ncbi:MAG: hypothetical protein WB770_05870 [Acidimicrobiales bacterium]